MITPTEAADKILTASGSGLKFYSTIKARSDIFMAAKEVVLESQKELLDALKHAHGMMRYMDAYKGTAGRAAFDMHVQAIRNAEAMK